MIREVKKYLQGILQQRDDIANANVFTRSKATLSRQELLSDLDERIAKAVLELKGTQ